MTMINKGIRFSQIENRNLNLHDFSTETLGFASYGAVTAAHSDNGYANMTTSAFIIIINAYDTFTINIYYNIYYMHIYSRNNKISSYICTRY